MVQIVAHYGDSNWDDHGLLAVVPLPTGEWMGLTLLGLIGNLISGGPASVSRVGSLGEFPFR